ncbi:hypothetical protein RRF57_011405 [Xylaria bambusicola]|uniref:Secreted protein n=1 Tax=Xylaria bambusicola TaxID=326684 RepID=A0AAN7ZE37_9PEZI
MLRRGVFLVSIHVVTAMHFKLAVQTLALNDVFVCVNVGADEGNESLYFFGLTLFKQFQDRCRLHFCVAAIAPRSARTHLTSLEEENRGEIIPGLR